MSLLGGSAGEVKTRRFSAETRNAKSRPRILKWVSLSVGRPSIARAGERLPGMVPKSSPTHNRVVVLPDSAFTSGWIGSAATS